MEIHHRTGKKLSKILREMNFYKNNYLDMLIENESRMKKKKGFPRKIVQLCYDTVCRVNNTMMNNFAKNY